MPHMSKDKTRTIRDKQGQSGPKWGQAGTMKEPVGANWDKQDQQGKNRDKEDFLSLLVPYWHCLSQLVPHNSMATADRAVVVFVKEFQTLKIVTFYKELV